MSEIEEDAPASGSGWYWNIDPYQFLFGIDVGSGYIDICFGPIVITKIRKQK